MFDGVGAEITTIPENTKKLEQAQKSGGVGGITVIGLLALLYGLSIIL